MQIKRFTCVMCPVGCALTAEVEGKTLLHVSGNRCKRGMEYAENECIHPMRTLCTTVRVEGFEQMLPVRSAKPLPKEKWLAYMALINRCLAKPPVKIGDVILSNIDGTGVDIIATQNISLI